MNDKKRSSFDGMMVDQVDTGDRTGGVGGRHRDRGTPTGGGGYLDICSESETAFMEMRDDPRLRELADMGLGSMWLRVADAVGVDNFMRVWLILDEKNMEVPPGLRDQARIRIPLFSRYLRFQRNKLITSLSADHSPVEIQKIIKASLCEDVSTTHISRIIKKNKV